MIKGLDFLPLLQTQMLKVLQIVYPFCKINIENYLIRLKEIKGKPPTALTVVFQGDSHTACINLPSAKDDNCPPNGVDRYNHHSVEDLVLSQSAPETQIQENHLMLSVLAGRYPK
jgi:hypothetical protein